MANMSNETKARGAVARKAFYAARNRLLDLHRDEFNTLYGEEREKVGLPREAPNTKLTEAEKLARKREKIVQQLAQIEERERALRETAGLVQ